MICVEIAFEERRVFLLGSDHSKNPEQLKLIKYYIEKFNPDVVLLEGNFDRATFDSVEDSIKYGADMGYASFLSKKKSIRVESNDPPFVEDKKFIENRYGSEMGELYFLLRDIPGASDEGRERIKILLKQILNEDFDEKIDYLDYFDPTISKNLFNEITKELNVFRDEYMLSKISELLNECSKIFVIKGDYHLNSCFEEIRSVVNGS